MKYILIIALTITTLTLANNGLYSPIPRALECKVAEVSLYNVQTDSTAKLNDHNTYYIELVKRTDRTIDSSLLKVNDEIYNRTKVADGMITYQRGRILIFKSDGRYYIKKMPSQYTGMLICK